MSLNTAHLWRAAHTWRDLKLRVVVVDGQIVRARMRDVATGKIKRWVAG